MKSFRMSNTMWKWFIAAFILFAAILLTHELFYAFKPLASGAWGSLGVQLELRSANIKENVITDINANSPFLKYSAVVGDVVIFDRVEDSLRVFEVGESVGVTLLHGGTARHVVVEAVAKPILSGALWDRMDGYVISFCAMFFALLVTFKQPESRTFRSLALYFLCISFNFTSLFSPPGLLLTSAQMLWGATTLSAFYFLVRFAIYYPSDQPTGLRARFDRRMPLFATCTIAVTSYLLWSFSGHDAPLLWTVVVPLFLIVSEIVAVAALWDGRRSSTGMSRQRHTWLLLSIGIASICGSLTALPLVIHVWKVGGIYVTTLSYDVAQLASYFIIVYAVWKHRVFNFGFAVNRALFYTATSLILLVAFGIIEWLSEHFLHFEAREANAMIDGGIALAVYLVFHRIRHGVEHWLERVFFHKWHVNEARLRQFVKQAPHITTAVALLRDYHAELHRFSGGADCAIYLRDVDGNYIPAAKSGVSSDERIDVNDVIGVTLRTNPVPMLIEDDHTSHAGELVLPMSHRGELHGFALLGAKPNGQIYRPDEIDVLGFAAHQIGLDLFALRIELLEEKNRTLQLSNETLQDVVAKIGGRLNALSA